MKKSTSKSPKRNSVKSNKSKNPKKNESRNRVRNSGRTISGIEDLNPDKPKSKPNKK